MRKHFLFFLLITLLLLSDTAFCQSQADSIFHGGSSPEISFKIQTQVNSVGSQFNSVIVTGGVSSGSSFASPSYLNSVNPALPSNIAFGGPGGGAFSALSFLFLQMYGELNPELDNSFYITSSGVLYFRYHEKYHQATGAQLKYKLYDYTRLVLDSTPITKKYGMNYFAIPLSTVAGITSGKYYILEVTDDKGQILKLRFKYI